MEGASRPVPALEHLQLKDRVYQHLQSGIVDGSYEIGRALREVELAQQIGVSKTPIREAFVRLEKERLVRLTPYKGVVVAGYSKRDLAEISEIRQLIEGSCAKKAATNATEADVAKMRENLAATVRALEADDTAAVTELFDDFDRLIYRFSDNKWIDDLLENLEVHQRRIGLLTVAIPGRTERSYRQHAGIVDAIGAGQEAKAERLMRNHVADVMADQLAAFTADE